MTTTTTSRRGLLAGAAAMPVALAAPAIGAASNRDADLFELLAEFRAVHTHMTAVQGRAASANTRYDAVRPARPKSMEPEALELRDLWNTITSGEFRRMPEHHPLRVWDRETAAARDAQWSDYHARINRLQEYKDVREAEAESNDAWSILTEIAREMLDMRAYTLAGIAAKIEAVELAELVDGDEEETFKSIATDVRALVVAGKVVAP